MDSQKPVENEFFTIENASLSKSAIMPNEDFDKRELEDEHGIERPFTNSDQSIQVGNEQDLQNSKVTTSQFNTQEELEQEQQSSKQKQDVAIPDLESCPNCRRKFFVGRLHLHLKNCTPEHPFKSKHPLEVETEIEKAQTKTQENNTKGQNKLLSPKRKKNQILQVSTSEDMSLNETDTSQKLPRWKQEHKQILDGIKYSREVEKAQKSGTNLKEVQDRAPKNPLEENYVFCQFCRRKFDPYVAERHIPRCKDIFNRPQPPKRKSMDQNHKKTTVKALDKYSQYVRASINEEVEDVDIETIQQHSKTVKTLIHKSKGQTFIDGVSQNRMSQSQQQSTNGSSVFLPKILQSQQNYVPMMSRSTPMVECVKCKRSFDERAAQRHIPICLLLNKPSNIEEKNSPSRLSPLKHQIPPIDTQQIVQSKQSIGSPPGNILQKGDKPFCTNCGEKYAQIHKYCGVCGKKRS